MIALILILLLLWFLGLLNDIGGGLIHLLLVVAFLVLIYRLWAGPRDV
jgi:hypothetical protein